MNTKQQRFEISVTELAERAADLAAIAVGRGLARMIEGYVPPFLVRRFARGVVESLLAEVTDRTTVCDPAEVRIAG